MTIKAVIFDMDGVIIDSEPLWREAEMLVFPRYGVPMTEEMCMQMKGTKIEDVVKYWHSVYNWQPPNLKLVEMEVIEKVNSLIREHGKPMPGLINLLNFLKAEKIKIGLATSSLYCIMDVVMDALGIAHLFDVMHSAEDEKAGKPAPDVYLGAAKKLGLKPSECLAVEDSITGIKSAKAAGMYTLALPELTDTDLEKYKIADRIIKSLEEIIDLNIL